MCDVNSRRPGPGPACRGTRPKSPTWRRVARRTSRSCRDAGPFCAVPVTQITIWGVGSSLGTAVGSDETSACREARGDAHVAADMYITPTRAELRMRAPLGGLTQQWRPRAVSDADVFVFSFLLGARFRRGNEYFFKRGEIARVYECLVSRHERKVANLYFDKSLCSEEIFVRLTIYCLLTMIV